MRQGRKACIHHTKTSAAHSLLIFSARYDHVVNKLGEASHVDFSIVFCRVPVDLANGYALRRGALPP
jgi:hypothetical protein